MFQTDLSTGFELPPILTNEIRSMAGSNPIFIVKISTVLDYPDDSTKHIYNWQNMSAK